VQISAEFSLTAGAWGVLDEVRLVDAASVGGVEVDTASLERALAAAASVDRERYTDISLAKLDDAVAVGEVVLAGSKATAADVKAATKLVDKAVSQLKKAKP
jgi:arabinogalactan endo-1,4-beta-galactosidase